MSMPQIQLLDQETIDKIAAGEVVERPSSVVKELVENAIDAKATAVTVEIKEGGTSFIRITDNGCGIDKEQVPTAFLRHSTSKIRSVEDLLCVSSLGFRGEALSSIAAVAQVELITKTYDELTGTRYVIEGSKEKENEEIGAPDGTTFIVRNLFFNTPARRKFLKSATTEGNYVADLMERMALSHPDVSFKFINNGQTKMHTSGNSNSKDLIYNIYGRDITSAILPVDITNEFFTVKGFIGKPVISRGNRNYESFFINGRYIKSALISKAVEEGYKGFMMQHQYPFAVLYFEMDTELLDVNVHPTKMELRFSDNEAIYKALYEIIRNTLSHREFISQVSVKEEKSEKNSKPFLKSDAPEPFEMKRIQEIRKAVAADSPYQRQYPQSDPLLRRETFAAKNSVAQSGVTDKTETATEAEIVSKTTPVTPAHPSKAALEFMQNDRSEADAVFARLSGKQQSAGTLEKKQPIDTVKADVVYTEILDTKQDKAETLAETNAYEQETVTYEQQNLAEMDTQFLSKDAKKKHRIIGQFLDTYWMVEYEEKLFIIDQHAAHEKVLYEKTMEKLSNKSFASQTISPPIILTLSNEETEMLKKYREQIDQFGYEIEPFGGKEYAITAIPADFSDVDMKAMFIDMLDDFANITGNEGPNLIMEKVASMSCKAAVKGHDHLSFTEAENLIDQLLELENPYNCPHGRPTIISMTKYELEKKFRRIV